MLCYFDLESANWGVGQDNIVFVDVTGDEADELCSMSDSEIIAWATERARGAV